MTSIPGNLSRAPNLLLSQGALSSLTRTSVGLFRAQAQLATGRAINRFSDDAVRGAAISVLDDRLERGTQRARNLQHADSALTTLDQALGEVSDLILEAKDIAATQVNTGFTSEEREAQAEIVTSMIRSLLTVVNREGAAGAIFGASTPGVQPVHEMLGGFRYAALGSGLFTDLGALEGVPITLGGGVTNPLGATSARVEGEVDLDPVLTGDTRLSDLEGARGLGVTHGEIEFSFDGGPRTRIDLTGVETAQDVADAISRALRDYEQAHSVQVLDSGGVGFSGGAFTVDVVPGGVDPDPVLRFFDVGSGTTAEDLGLRDGQPVDFVANSAAGLDARPRLTVRTAIDDLAGVAGALGSIRVNNLGQTRIIDLSQAQTVGDLRSLIEGAGIGLRVEVNSTATGINVVNEVSAGRAQAMSIEEIAGADGNMTATRLGIRSLTGSTRLSDLNDGRGVQLVHGSIDPISGLPDPALDVDFVITLGDGASTEIEVDLRPQDLLSIQTVLDRINASAAAQGVSVPASFEARIGDGANGIELRQSGAFGQPLTVSGRNNSPAAEQLGLLDGAFDPQTGTLRGEDRGRVRVDGLFTRLIDLRDSLLEDDTAGITLAGERLESSVDLVAQGRALVGSYASRVDAAEHRLEDQTLLDERTRSELRDLDFTEAAVRLSLLQAQMEAGLRSMAAAASMSLLDFLG
jgi:flagellin-like hook-associated protein FlgL